MTARGRTDFERTDSDDELARQTRMDVDLQNIPADWYEDAKLEYGTPVPPTGDRQRLVTMRLDPEVIDYFQGLGQSWQTRINAVLKAFVDEQRS